MKGVYDDAGLVAADVLVAMNAEGRITILAAARRQLGLEGAAQF